MSMFIKFAAVVFSLIGLTDSIYLTVHHYTDEPVPCSIIAGCETVLTSSYAEIAGIPLAAFGSVAYFFAFSLAILSVYGNRTAWKLFGLQSVLMAAFSIWLIYVQAVLIKAFCQFCLLSALTSFVLLILFLISFAVRSTDISPSADLQS